MWYLLAAISGGIAAIIVLWLAIVTTKTYL